MFNKKFPAKFQARFRPENKEKYALFSALCEFLLENYKVLSIYHKDDVKFLLILIPFTLFGTKCTLLVHFQINMFKHV